MLASLNRHQSRGSSIPGWSLRCRLTGASTTSRGQTADKNTIATAGMAWHTPADSHGTSKIIAWTHWDLHVYLKGSMLKEFVQFSPKILPVPALSTETPGRERIHGVYHFQGLTALTSGPLARVSWQVPASRSALMLSSKNLGRRSAQVQPEKPSTVPIGVQMACLY